MRRRQHGTKVGRSAGTAAPAASTQEEDRAWLSALFDSFGTEPAGLEVLSRRMHERKRIARESGGGDLARRG